MKGHSAVQHVSLCLCSLLAATSQFSIPIGQKMQLTGWENANNVRNATCAASKTSKVPTQDHWALQYLEERLGENKWLQKHGGFSPLLTPDPRHMVPPAKGIYHWPGSVLKQAHLLHPPGFFARNCFWSFRNTFSQYFLNFFRTFFNLLQIFEMDEVETSCLYAKIRKCRWICCQRR